MPHVRAPLPFLRVILVLGDRNRTLLMQGDITDESFVLSLVEKVKLRSTNNGAQSVTQFSKVRPDFVFHMAAQASRQLPEFVFVASHSCHFAEFKRRQRGSAKADL
jgi:2-phosphoglycerate kinase